MKMTLENMAFIAYLFKNDCLFLHHNVRGESFEEAHEKFGEYYTKALEDLDFFAEHAIIKELDVMPNFSNVHSTEAFEYWERCEGESELEVSQAYNMFVSVGEDYLEALELCRAYCDEHKWNDIVSYLDDLHGEWSVIIEYKAEKSK